MNASLTRFLVSCLALATLQSTAPRTVAQEQPDAARPAPVCDRTRALAIVQEQLAEARNVEKPVEQIRLFVRAADLLWPRQQEAARAAFAEAYELAAKYFRENGDENRVGKDIYVMVPDQRFLVLSAIAKRDPAWVKQLAERAAAETREGADKARKARGATEEVGGNLIGLAISLLGVNREVALGLARSSFRHPASYNLPNFFLMLAATDRPSADRLFREALAAYANASTEELTFLAVYPFALDRIIAPVEFSTSYNLPSGFAPDPALQAPLVEAFARRAERVARAQGQTPADGFGFPETAQLFAALTNLEPLVARSLPQLSQKVSVARAMAGASLSDSARESADGFLRRQGAEHEGRYGDEWSIERAERETDPAQRDQAIAFALLAASDADSSERVMKLADEVSDENLRRGLLDWLYFSRAQKATRDGLLDEAARMAEKVEELDFRALLSMEIAAESIKRLDDRARAVELLDAVVKSAAKAPDTPAKARAYLGVAHLEARLDPARSVEALAAAVKTINQLREPDFTSESIGRQVRGKDFAIFTGYNAAGFNLENAFRAVGARDFDGALDAARSIEYRPLRAAAALAITAECLERAEKQREPGGKPKPEPGKKQKPPKGAPGA